ncbi:uncharacterized protein LOC117892454 [Drosophila subobscura]|uniref:uncharacterized protein LOC117892454 n=1 Tax=Drosophila subobscura TaxID=7241 RepID=UPI00155A736F|nr:uncharacterized protein LOC117892454 [Drosophila subobscura]
MPVASRLFIAMACAALSVLVLLCCLSVVLASEEAPHVFKKGNINFILESLETTCDHDYVEYFRKVPEAGLLYTFRVVRPANAFSIDITVKVLKTQRVLYRTANINGCEFLRNPLMSKVFGTVYKQLVVNGSFFKCPIPPKVYFLKNEATVAMFPTIHPPGHFQLSMRVKMSESRQPYVMEMLWKYKIVRNK